MKSLLPTAGQLPPFPKQPNPTTNPEFWAKQAQENRRSRRTLALSRVPPPPDPPLLSDISDTEVTVTLPPITSLYATSGYQGVEKRVDGGAWADDSANFGAGTPGTQFVQTSNDPHTFEWRLITGNTFGTSDPGPPASVTLAGI